MNGTTAIVEELPSARNAYLARDVRVHGYSLRKLCGAVTFTEMLFLQMRGEYPDRRQLKLLDDVLIALSSPGPRHPAGRAAREASSSETASQNVLPLALCVLSGERLGAKECADAMRFIKGAYPWEPAALYVTLRTQQVAEANAANADRVAPGFGTRFGGRDPLPAHFLTKLARRGTNRQHLRWAQAFSRAMAADQQGPLATGLAAAAFLDLGFTEAQGAGLFQISAAPHLVALGAEVCGKGVAAMPFLPDHLCEVANVHTHG